MMFQFVLARAASAVSAVLPLADGRGQVCPVAPAGAQNLVGLRDEIRTA